jgi:hypothetical protein
MQRRYPVRRVWQGIEVIGVTIINARRIIEHDGYLTITLPRSVRVEAGELAAALG